MSVLAPPFTGDPVSIPIPYVQDRKIGSLWRRLVAFFIDGILVGVAASIVTLPFFQTLVHLGPWGRLMGFCMAIPYFAILDSAIGNGQTIGKRWLHLQVVDANGNTISFWKSLVRYAVFAVPYYLNGIPLSVTRTPWVVNSLVAVAVFGLGGATFYLMIFNRHTRQGLHDLAVRSYVAEAEKVGEVKTQRIWKMHWVILVSLLAIVLPTAGILGNELTDWEPFPQLLQDVQLVENMEGVQRAAIQDTISRNSSRGDKEKIFVANVFWSGQSADEEALADRIAKALLESDTNIQNHDILRIVVTRGYDLGIAESHVNRTFDHTPAEWDIALKIPVPSTSF